MTDEALFDPGADRITVRGQEFELVDCSRCEGTGREKGARGLMEECRTCQGGARRGAERVRGKVWKQVRKTTRWS